MNPHELSPTSTSSQCDCRREQDRSPAYPRVKDIWIQIGAIRPGHGAQSRVHPHLSDECGILKRRKNPKKAQGLAKVHDTLNAIFKPKLQAITFQRANLDNVFQNLLP